MDFQLPELGEGIYEAELTAWLVDVGETVKHGQSLMEVVTDKASMEVPSPFAGTIASLNAEPGEQIKVGEVVLTYTPAEKAAAGEAKQQPPATGKESDVKRRRPDGERLPEHSPVVARSPARPTAPTEGLPGGLGDLRSAVGAGSGDPRTTGATLGAGSGDPRTTREPASRTPAASATVQHAVQAAPSVRRMARALGIDLEQVQGSGPGGRVLIDDLSAHLRQVVAQVVARSPDRATGPTEGLPGDLGDLRSALGAGSGDPRTTAKEAVQPRRTATPPPVLALELGTAGTRIKLQGVRRKIADHMILSKRTIPHFSYVDECDVTELVRLRDSLREPYAQAGVKLTYLAFFVKAAVAALKKAPIVNASLDETDGEIVLHDKYHIGIATATPKGLIVPVLRDADRKDVAEIAREIDRLSAAAKTGNVKLEDLRGSTFTITSIGSIGGLISTPVINHPEVAILGIGKVVKRPIYDEAGQLHPADLVYLSFSFDHRVVDGAVGAVFANALIQAVQNPATLLLPEDLTEFATRRDADENGGGMSI